MKASKLDLIIGVIVCVIGLFMFWNTYTIPPPLQPDAPGAATFPIIIIIMLIFFGVLLSYNGLSQKRKEEGAATISIFNKIIFTAVGLIGLYLEYNLIHALMIHRGDFMIIFKSPICVGILALSLYSAIYGYIREKRSKKKE